MTSASSRRTSAGPETRIRPVAASDLGAAHGVEAVTDTWPIQVVGSGATVNDATQNAFDRTAALFGITEGEVRARCTFTGGVQIGRLPGVVQLNMLVPAAMLDGVGLADVVTTHYAG